MPILAQITIWQNPETGSVTAEIPHNGGRRKIDLDPQNPDAWGSILKFELDAASEWERRIVRREAERKYQEQVHKEAMAEKAQDAAWERHRQNYDYVARTQGVKFSEKKIGPRNRNSKPKLYIEDLMVQVK